MQESRYRVRNLKKPRFGRKKNNGAELQATSYDYVRKADKPVDDTFGLIKNDDGGFEVKVRNSEALMKRLDSGKAVPFWRRDLQVNLACAAVLMVLLSLLLTAADASDMIPFALPGLVVFMAVAALEYLDNDRIKLYVAVGCAVALLVTLIIFRKYIGNGWAIIMNQLYDEAEAEQAYIYNRFPIGAMGDEHPYRSQHFALVWSSSLLGLILAVIPARMRRATAMVIAAFSMIAFAYYGIIPSWACIAVMAAALLFVLSRGSLLSSLTVLLAGMLVFGAVFMIDPGESYTISRADENFRDRFALKSSYLESNGESMFGYDEFDQEMMEETDEFNDDEGILSESRNIVKVIIAVLIIAAIAAAVWMFVRRLRKRQLANRNGIDSVDAREAIVAMFPYAVRWLQPAGIDTTGRSFDSLIPTVKADVSGEYGESFASMYELWKEAAYSDHEIDAESKQKMNTFLQDTITMIKKKGNFARNLLNTIKYAL